EVGLGSELSGGFSPSLFENLKEAVISSRMLEDGVDATKKPEVPGVKTARITVNEAFNLATVGGGLALSLPIRKLEKE
ncbi:guanine deaminase, partial [Enterococcus faecalis]